MSKQQGGSSNGESQQSLSLPLARRPEVSTNSILESFLLDKITLDETLTREDVQDAVDTVRGTDKKRKKRETDDAAIEDIRRECNSQRQDIRKSIRQGVASFSKTYDAQPVPTSERYEQETDTQEELLREHVTLDDMLDRLQKAETMLQSGCSKLERKIARHQAVLKSAVAEMTVEGNK